MRKKIKFRVNEFYERAPVPVFTEEEDEFQLDEENDCLVKVGVINLQEKIQSNEDCALDKILDKYLDTDDARELSKIKAAPIDPNLVHENYRPDLADLGAEYERVENLKEKYGLDPYLSYEETLKALQGKKKDLDAYILKLEKEKEIEKKNLDAYRLKLEKEKENEKKEVVLQEKQENV